MSNFRDTLYDLQQTANQKWVNDAFSAKDGWLVVQMREAAASGRVSLKLQSADHPQLPGAWIELTKRLVDLGLLWKAIDNEYGECNLLVIRWAK